VTTPERSTTSDRPVPPDDLVRVEDLQVSFDGGRTHAVDGVTLSIGVGEIVGIVGESGCGKSATAAALLGLLPGAGRVTRGRIMFGGLDLATLPDKKFQRIRGSDLAMIFQDPLSSLNPAMRVGAQIDEAIRVHERHGGSRAAVERRKRVARLLDEVRIAGGAQRAADYPHQFSGGMRQRIMIAMGLANSPQLIVADEPTTALDVTIQAQILQLLRRVNTETGASVLFISHDIEVVASLCDRVVVMYAGRIVEQGPTKEIFARPQHPYTWSLLRAAPGAKKRGNRERLLAIPGLPPTPGAITSGCRFRPRCPFSIDACGVEPELLPVDEDRSVRCHVTMDRAGDAIRPSARPSRAASGSPAERRKLVAVSELRKTYERRSGFGRALSPVLAVDNLSLDIVQGETLGLVGESGCGKSTLGRLLVGLERPTAGTIEIDGVDVDSLRGRVLRRARRRMQMVFQDPYSSLDPRWTVGTSIAEPLFTYTSMRRRERESRVAEMLELCGLATSYASRYPHELSGGQRQRVAIARALILDPDVVVADEPVSALDVSVQAQIVNLLQDIQDARKLTYVFISHDLSVVRHVSDRVAVMYLGRVVELGQTERVYGRPRHPYTAMLHASVPSQLASSRVGAADVPKGELPSPANVPTGCSFHPRCPIAQFPLCREVTPELRLFADGSKAACHMAVDDATEAAVDGSEVHV
jgi:peptide/nickel transport system ATP-binding protein